MTSSDHNNAAEHVNILACKTIHLADHKDNNNSLQINFNVLPFILKLLQYIGLFGVAMSTRSASHRPRQDWRALRDISPMQG